VRPASRPSFFRLPTLMLMGLLAAGAFYLLYPRQSFFEALRNAPKPDSVSLAYMSILQSKQQADPSLQISLAENQLRSGSYDQGLAALRGILSEESIPLAQLKGVLPLLTPEDQVRLLPRFIAFDKSGEHLWLQRLLGNALLATSQPGRAADSLAAIMGKLPVSERGEARQELIRRYLAAEKPEQALKAFKAGGLPENTIASLKQGIRLAELTGDIDAQIEWLKSLSMVEEDNFRTLLRLFRLQLGERRIRVAAETGVRLLAYKDRLSASQLSDIARSLEWAGMYAKAQVLWRQIYSETASPEAFKRATTLARERFDWAALSAILSVAGDRRVLAPDEWLQWSDALLRQGEIEPAMTMLERGLLEHPENDMMSGRLFVLYFNNQRFDDAIALLKDRRELTEQQRILLANLYWRTRSPEEALKVLQAPFSDVGFMEEAFQLRLDLALILDDSDALRKEYEKLIAQKPASMDSELAERVIGLALFFDEQLTALELSEARYAITRNARLLPILAELQAASGRWADLGRTLSVWLTEDPAIESNARYWLLLGRYYEQSQRPSLAESAYRSALMASPGNTDVLSSWAWLLLANDERPNSKLRLILDELSQQGESASSALLSYGTDVLEGAQGAPTYASNNRLLQAGWFQEDLDRLAVSHRYITLNYAFEDYRITAVLDDLGISDDTFYRASVSPGADARFTLASNQNSREWQWEGGIGRHDRLGDNDLWAGMSVRYNPTERWQFQWQHYQGERATDSAEAWWLMSKNRTGLEARYQPWSRLDLTAGVDALSFDTSNQDDIATGHELTLGSSYQIARGNIAWNVRSEYNRQRLTDIKPLAPQTRILFTQPITTRDLLTENYERIGLGSRWYHGDPHGLFRQDASPRWFVDVAAGYVLSSSSVDMGASAGIGWSLMGNDELALSTGYASDGLNNESRLNAKISYTLYFSDLRRSQ